MHIHFFDANEMACIYIALNNRNKMSSVYLCNAL